VFHLELRQFPNVARAFNLSAGELHRRFLEPWVAGRMVELDDRRFSPERARLLIYEGPELAPEAMGLGRGWANVTRSGTDVTARLLEHTARDPALEELKADIVARVPLGLPEILALAHHRWPERRASERLAFAELAVWELLHQQRVRVAQDGEPVPREQWEPLILAWETWTGQGLRAPVVQSL
jgi:hypothetical protein